jgi:hypothetical protein
MAKVSFDFDGTLSRPDVQEYASRLLAEGVDVWVVTTRYDQNHKHKYALDYDVLVEDLWEVVDRIGIPRWKVRFTNMEWKYTYLIGTNFVWHLDDNANEMTRARYNSCPINMIQVGSSSWKRKCSRLLNMAKAKPEEPSRQLVIFKGLK